MKKCKLIPAVVGMMAMFASCTDEVPAIPDSELYTREWVKKFGAVNPDQDWNAATSAGVDVTTDAPARVQITARIQGKNYLVADYADVSGTRTLKFDIPKGVKEVTVISGSERYTAPIGGKVSFAGAGRSVPGTGSTEITAELITNPDQWMVVPILNATMFRSKMPEGAYNANRDGVSVDFSFKFKENDIIVRPLYWQTSQVLSFGFFYLDENDEPVHFPIYDMEKTSQQHDYSNWTEDLVLSYAPTEVKSVTITDFRNDEAFISMMKNEGIEFEHVKAPYEEKYFDLVKLSATDNFYGKCSAVDDGKMTRACRAYLEYIGYVNSPDAPEDKRYNYVYRWKQTGNTLVNYEGQDRKEDLEIIFTHYNYHYDEAKSFYNKDNLDGDGMLGKLGGIQNGYKRLDEFGYPAMICKGIKVHIEDISRTYGAYVHNGTKYMYSMSALNKGENRWIPKPGAERTEASYDYLTGLTQYKYKPDDFMIEEGKNAYRSATWEGEKYKWRYMSFEDGAIQDKYNPSACDFDMQDFVFIIDDFTPDSDIPNIDIIDEEKPEPIKWVMACEDLGSKDDFDFNDVVFEVEYVAGSGKATITPLAAGGTLETYLWRYNKQGEAKQLTGEWHGLFSAGHTEMVNTTTHSRMAESFDIEVEEGFSIASPNGSENYRDVMGGFFLKIGEEEREVTPPVKSEAAVAPQMILIFQPEGEPWLWPRERMAIDQAYEGFTKWMTDGVFDAVEGDNIWSRRPNKSCVVERKR